MVLKRERAKGRNTRQDDVHNSLVNRQLFVSQEVVLSKVNVSKNVQWYLVLFTS